MNKSNYIQIPLTIGLNDLKDNNNSGIKLISFQHSLQFLLKNNQKFQEYIKKNSQRLLFHCQIENSKILISNGLIPDKSQKFLKNSIKTFQLYKKQSQSLIKNPFSIKIKNTNKRNKFNLQFCQQNINFQLIKVNSQVKFVNNTLLSKLLSNNSSLISPKEEQGLLTLDQQGRILLDNLNMPFPTIGFWFKTQNHLQSLQVYSKLSQFIKNKPIINCVFKDKTHRKQYFYFVKITKQIKNPQLYLVTYEKAQDFNQSFDIQNNFQQVNFNIKDGKLTHTLNQNSQIVNLLDDETQNGMQFTLRNKKQRQPFQSLQSLINYSYLSPIKQLQADEQDNKNQINSPQFSTLIKKQQSQIECLLLRQKVQIQNSQINELKQLIKQMQSELLLYKHSRLSTNCSSNNEPKLVSSNNILSPSTNNSLFGFTSNSNQSNSNSHANSPQQVRRLRQSDLRSGSTISPGADWLRNSSNKKKLMPKNFLDTQSPKQPMQFYAKNMSTAKKQMKYQAVIFQENQCANQTQPQNICYTYDKQPKVQNDNERDPWDYMEIVQQ